MRSPSATMRSPSCGNRTRPSTRLAARRAAPAAAACTCRPARWRCCMRRAASLPTAAARRSPPYAPRVALAASIVRGMDARERAVAGVPCPLLENERCTAYRARPIACRGANSADAGACQSVAGNPDDVQIPSYTHQRKVLLHTRQWDRRGPAGGGRAEPSARTRGRARPRSRPRRPTGGVAVRRPRLQRGALQGGRPGGGAGGPRMNPR